MRARISWSVLAWPGGSRAFHFHCIQRAELVKVPSFSAKSAAGSEEDLGRDLRTAGGPPYSGGAFQNAAVSVSHVLDHDQPLQLRERRHHLLGAGPEAHRVHAEGDEPFGAGLVAAGAR